LQKDTRASRKDAPAEATQLSLQPDSRIVLFCDLLPALKFVLR